jgi:catecholate siderophore receptor
MPIAPPRAPIAAGRGSVRRRRGGPSSSRRKPFAVTQDARTGTVGYYSDSTGVATKTNTPLINVPQSVAVLTKDFISDQGTHSITDLSRYVPGVVVHQGEGNRDELIIRGVDSSANFFVNGFRDDVQYYRDIYNTQSIEVLKGPSALAFGRGAGGGVVNRTLKEADGTTLYEASAQTGSYGDRRVTLDAGQAVNENVAVRLNTFYEGSDTFRDFGHLERYGFNPTVTLKPDDDTKVKLSYEFYHDKEVADRGNPSIGTGTRFNPTSPFAPAGDLTAFFGSPAYNNTFADVQTGMAVVEHDFGNGLTVKNSSLYADFNRAYQNVYPGSSVAGGTFSYNAYNHTTNRENAFNQTDFIYKTMTGRSVTRLRSAPSSTGRPASIFATPAFSPAPQAARLRAIRSIRHFSAPSTSFTSFREHFRPASAVRTPSAPTSSLSIRPTRRTKLKSRAGCS